MAAVVFLFGLAATLTGAFIRSCQQVPAEFFQAWCGAQPHSLDVIQHQHCVGCVLSVVGLGLMFLSLRLAWMAPRQCVKRTSR